MRTELDDSAYPYSFLLVSGVASAMASFADLLLLPAYSSGSRSMTEQRSGVGAYETDTGTLT
jgi:hypothetical protein